MAELRQFKLPDVGEGLTEADIVRWLVAPGDTISINQIIVEIETAKAVVELPSPYQGVVADLLVPEGETAEVGMPIISVQVGSPASAETARPPVTDPGTAQPPPGQSEDGQVNAHQVDAGQVAEISAAPADGAVEPGVYGSPAPKAERQAVLVGYGVKLGATKRRPRKAVPARPAGQPAPRAGALSAQIAPAAERGSQVPTSKATTVSTATNGSETAVLAKPPVRKLARDLGVDLTMLTGTGPAGSITREDIQAAASQPADLLGLATAQAVEPGGLDRAAAMRLASLPREERVAIRGVRKHTAAAMASSAFTAPHVTEFLQIDISQTMSATVRLRSLPEFDQVRVTPLLLVAKALLVAANRHPLVNSSWDEAAQEIVVKHYVNLGIATATDRGLVVPSVKDAHALSLPELARAISKVAEVARAGKSSPGDLRGGTITITNVGVFGVDTGTPIISPGEAAILAFGQVRDAPWVVDGQLAVRKVCTLALSFDHRIIDGDVGSAVLREVGAMLTDPLRMLAWS